MRHAGRAVGETFPTLVLGIAASTAAQAQVLPDASPPSMDASGLIAATGSASQGVQRLVRSFELVPDNVALAVRWVGSPADWLAITVCTILLVAVAWLVGRTAARLPRSTASFAGWLLGGTLAVGAGFLLHFALPVSERVRAVSFAIFLCAAAVALGTSLVRLLLRRARVAGEDELAHVAALGFSLIALGYILLGLMRLSGGDIEARLVIGMVIWMALIGLAALFIARFRFGPRRRRSEVLQVTAGVAHDPISHLLSRQMEWFFGSVLLLIAVLTVVTALRESPRAFLSGTMALLLLGALPAAMTLLPLPTISKEGAVQPWRATVRRCGRLLVFIAFWLVLAWLFDIDLVDVASDRFGERAVRVFIDIGIAVALGYLFWQVAAAILDSLSSREVAGVPGDPERFAAHGASRIETFIPLLRTITVAFIVMATGMIILASMGINIGPLLAGAGIFGIAIGFGSQALVKDVISGLFFLADDAFRIGEYVEVGSAKGTVESISIRSMKVRHPRGAVFTVPFGQIGVVNNQSRDWAIIKLEFLVDFSTDLRKAKQIVRQIGANLAADEEFGKALLQPVKFQGVRRMEPFGMVVGVKFTAIPGEQFLLQREVYARVRDAFAEADIHFARPRVQVDGSAAGVSAQALEAAALTAMQASAPPPEEEDAKAKK